MRFIGKPLLLDQDISAEVDSYFAWQRARNAAPPPKDTADDDPDASDKTHGTIIISLDLGFSVDYSALCAVEALPDGMFAVRKIERWPLQTPYAEVIERTVEIYKRLRAKGHVCRILVDIGGARGVWEMLRDKNVDAMAVQIIGSGKTRIKGSTFYVVKADMVSNITILANPAKPRVKVPRMSKYAKILKEELRNYEIRLSETTGSATFGAFANKSHDDVVSALGVALLYHVRYSGGVNKPRVRWI